MLDLSLPDSTGLDTFIRLYMQAPDVPIVVLTGLDDEATATQAVQAGAQDYLVKGHVSGDLLVRAMRYAIERHRLLMQLRVASLVDALTGLYNRRAFLNEAKSARHPPRTLLYEPCSYCHESTEEGAQTRTISVMVLTVRVINITPSIRSIPSSQAL